MKCLFHNAVRACVLALFVLNSVMPTGYVSAQVVSSASQLVALSPRFCPAIVRGLSVYPQDPFRFDFIVDTGDGHLNDAAFTQESEKLIKYFLAALTVPEKELWVNLSPYEKDRMIPDGLGGTQMGIDMLAQDYLLKRMTASLTHPDSTLGRSFWDRVYAKVFQKFGTTDISLNTFNKVWIAPDKAVVYEKDSRVVIAERHLRVLLEKDYLALSKASVEDAGEDNQAGRDIQQGMIKDILLPEIEQEVNTGKNFAVLRQIYNSMILASWYKKRLHDSVLGQSYADTNKISGVSAEDRLEKERIYQEYLNTFRKGVFNLIKEEQDPRTRQMVPHKYFSGGLTVGAASVENLVVLTGDMAQLPASVQQFIVRPESAVGQDRKVTWQAVDKTDSAEADPKLIILDSREAQPFLPINPVADFNAREFPDIKVAERHGGIPLLIDVSDDLKTLTYYEVLDDSKVFSPEGVINQDILRENNGTLRKIASFPSSYLISPRKWMLEHFKGMPEGAAIERVWPQGKRYTRYRGVTASWDMQVDRDVWTTNIDTLLLHQTLLEAGALSQPAGRVKRVAEIGVGGGHLSALLAKTYPDAQVSITDISAYALSATLLNISANDPRGVASLARVRKFWGRGISSLPDRQDLIVINPPYIPAAPFEKGPVNDPYRGTGLIREIIQDGFKKLNPDNPEAAIYIDISSLADKDVRQYLLEFGDTISFEPVGAPVKVPLKIRWMSEAWKQWLLKENGGLERIENPAPDQEEYWHTLQMYRIQRKPEIIRPKRVAIIGGTFDPLHIAHRKMIDDVKVELGVDEVIVVPTNVSPHKQGKFSAPKEIRLAMAKAAVAGMPGVKVSDFDVLHEGPSYTIDLVDHLRGQYPEHSKFFFVIGDDNVEKLDTWKNIDELTQKVYFVTYTRPGRHVTNPRIKVARIERPGIDISATLIRQRVALGLPLTGFVTPEVERMIQENVLYLPEDIFSSDNHDPIYSLNGQAFKEDKLFSVIADAHGTLLQPTWKKEIARAAIALGGLSMEQAVRWVEDRVVAQMVDTLRDVQREEVVAMLQRDLALRNISKTKEEILAALAEGQKYFERAEMSEAIPGAIEAVRDLKEMGIPVRIVTGRDSRIVIEQLKHAGFGDLLSEQDVFGKDRQDALPIREEDQADTPRERMIRTLAKQTLDRRIIFLDDWIESARIVKELDGIFIAEPQGTGLEQKRNSNRLRAEGAALEVTNEASWRRLVSLVKVLDQRREKRTHEMVIKKARVAMSQMNPKVGDMDGNYNKMVADIGRAKAQGVDVLVFPEMSLIGYPPEDHLREREFVDQNKALVALLAQEARGITAVVGFADVDQWGQVYNALAVLSDGEVKGIYRKNALPNYGVFDDKRTTKPGKGIGLYAFDGNPLNKDVFDLNGLLLAFNVCEDIWVNPDGEKEDGGKGIQEPVDHDITASYLAQAAKGARLIINASASPYRTGVFDTRTRLVQKRARETNATIVYVNTVGGQDEVVYDGNSMIVSPDGRVLARGKPFEEDFVVLDLDVKTEQWTEKERKVAIALTKPVADEDKPEIPPVPEVAPSNDIKLLFDAIILGMRDYLRKNGVFKGVVFGNSGGIDSALMGAMAVIAYGPEQVHSASLPTQFNSDATKTDARKLAENLKMGFEEIPIQKAFEEILKMINGDRDFQKATGVTVENIQARLRMIFLMARANENGWLLLSTSNKSESSVGWATMYGDTSGGLAPFKDLSKTDIFRLARYVNEYLGREVIPVTIINRPPSPELKDGQKTSDTIPDYQKVLDPMLQLLVEKNLSAREVEKTLGLPLPLIRRIQRMLKIAEWKRRQTPPGIKVTGRAFGRDRRMPITDGYDPERVENFIHRVGQEQTKDLAEAAASLKNSVALAEVLVDTTVPFWELLPEEYVAYLNRFSGNHKYPLRQLDAPPSYTASTVLRSVWSPEMPDNWAQPDLDDPMLSPSEREARDAQVRAEIKSWSPGTNFVNGRPQNTLKTGLKGRGKFGKYGENQTEDPSLFRYGPGGTLEALVVERGDGTGFGFAGGFTSRGQENMLGVTATREGIEETMKESPFAVDFSKGKLIYDERSYSSRDTDEAWGKTRALAVLLSYEQSQKLVITGADDAKWAGWLPVDQKLLSQMIDCHPQIMKRAVSAILSGDIQVRDDLVRPKDVLLQELAAIEDQDAAMGDGKKGGIDFDPAMMGLEIKTEGRISLVSGPARGAMPLRGLSPVIVSIVPVDVAAFLAH